MKPVLVFRHIACEGPGYLAPVLKKRKIPFEVINIDEGAPVPDNLKQVSGLVFMGGPMSVNDPLPWIAAELELIRRAHEQRIPILGHCLGGQLICRALGGVVMRNPVPEIGWFPLVPVVSDEALAWISDLSFATELFHWHGETFTLPDQAVPLFRSRHCSNQGFALHNTLALQCHVEVTKDDVIEWARVYSDEISIPGESVQSAAEMLRDIDRRVAALHNFADRLYGQWLNGFVR